MVGVIIMGGAMTAAISSPRRPLPRAVIFDAGNTLIQMNYAVIASYLNGRGHAVDEAGVHEAELRARVRLDADLAVPRTSTESVATHTDYLRYVLDHLGITGEDEVEAIADWRLAYNPPVGLWNRADPEAAAALGRVKRAGLVAGVISNSNGSARPILEATGLARYLDFVLDSSVVGVEKPDRRIFELALREAGVAAGEAVYVGDLYSVDVLGARAAGLDAILLDPRGFWGPRDCRLARSLAGAVSLLLGEAT
jgi:putative hydrolase of the HAD superfamily